MSETFQAFKCSSCGSPDFWQDLKNPNLLCCKACGTTLEKNSTQSQAQPHEESKQISKDKLETNSTQSQAQPQEESKQISKDNTDSSSATASFLSILVIGIMSVCVLGFFGYLVYQADKHIEEYTERKVEENIFGAMEIPPLIGCSSSHVIVEYGFKNQEPILTVYPGVEGKDRWVISKDLQRKIAVKSNSDSTESYLWVHCDKTDNEPSYFASWFPAPENGVKVVIKKDDKE